MNGWSHSGCCHFSHSSEIVGVGVRGNGGLNKTNKTDKINGDRTDLQACEGLSSVK